ncbi:hypothetical protein [Pseudarthrobacter sulfonivorans]|uniref:hypothetical protein n=1 Tax=Pseudarthrobacter sulfonivorans TaxID=121292 RepID=UPI002787091F|nr:hypothetical protein [Pseudarthrobacter sulfonivorans]MDP9999067.1 hypothetical protein [Pseudarthrobacter sulfonivorans]
MPAELFPETDPEEVQHSKRIVLLLERVEKLSAKVGEHVDVAPGSRLASDDARTPSQPVSGYGYNQLIAAVGCLEALGRMGIRDDGETISLAFSPFGAYALIRNSLDAAASALWLLEPASSTLRVKRRLLLGVDEVKNSSSFRRSMGRPNVSDWKQIRRARFKEIASSANLAGWNPLKNDMPTMTSILEKLERHPENVVIPWLPAWQLASGHAHGKLWAQIASHQMDELADTRNENGATFKMVIQYGMLAVLLFEAVQLIEAAGGRYVDLATAPAM